MQQYLEETKRHWNRRYEAENVEGWVFRMYGQILKAEFSIDGSGGEKLLDFGCGEGSALAFSNGVSVSHILMGYSNV